jgi:hypothetical protein
MLHSIILYTKRALSLSFEHDVAMVAFVAMKRLAFAQSARWSRWRSP